MLKLTMRWRVSDVWNQSAFKSISLVALLVSHTADYSAASCMAMVALGLVAMTPTDLETLHDFIVSAKESFCVGLEPVIDKSEYEALTTLLAELDAVKARPTLNELAERQFDWLTRMGWTETNQLEDLALVASEIGEAVNECRGEAPTPAFGTELADIILRVLGIAQKNGIDIEQAVLNKMAINEQRGTRGRLK